MKFYGELLIFILLFITNTRVFFLKRAKRDPVVSLAPLSVILTILLITAWGLDFFTISAFIISILVLLSNFHALFRYTERLYIDHYSPLMIFWSLLTGILSVSAIIGMFIFHPVELQNQDLGITETKTRVSGTLKNGFDKVNSFKSSDANFYTFKSEQATDDNLVLFIPDKRGDTFHYRPYLQKLAQNGYTVISADFFTSDCKWIHTIEDAKISRRFSLTARSILKNQWFMLQREYYTYNISLELNALNQYISETYGPDASFFLICDSMGNAACEDFVKQNAASVKGLLKLDSIPQYTTAGYGFISETDPLLYYILKKEFVSKQDYSDDIVKITDKNIKASFKDESGE